MNEDASDGLGTIKDISNCEGNNADGRRKFSPMLGLDNEKDLKKNISRKMKLSLELLLPPAVFQ